MKRRRCGKTVWGRWMMDTHRTETGAGSRSGRPEGLVVLGSTGSIGTQTLDVVRRHPERFRVVGLVAGTNDTLLYDQIREFRPDCVAVKDEASLQRLLLKLHALPEPRRPREIGFGPEAIARCAVHPEAVRVMSALVGFAGVRPTLAALQAGKTVLLANKETLVAAGSVVRAAEASGGGRIVPVDSEHAAARIALRGQPPEAVLRLVLTASGGAFRHLDRAALADVTVRDALRHPTWRMGKKLTVDSATLMNKGLEVIEAHVLFGLPLERIDVVLHDESLVHAMVELKDGTFVAVLGPRDMRLPIQQALFDPESPPALGERLDLARIGALHFRPVDPARYPALGLAYAAARAGGTAPAVLSAANEVAVAAFLDGRLPFAAIEAVVEAVLAAHAPVPATDLETIEAADRWARERARAEVLARSG
ncbi:1-deoxy-D-xylulose-5-phosphate reductoisomerase [Hydrogenibacillus sp. N12]|uniref:1-deoxy-D-xylulose-5-phosphate reductoisomerase n=1 Tax=Hydrogenibacillus sp. N12 TaxID=2866627 RepID=UPI00207BD4F7|nr:1-deoxy-D-xylulose-5-phosphate reductoisomerase [Hydrogenibacillus sp. N12]